MNRPFSVSGQDPIGWCRSRVEVAYKATMDEAGESPYPRDEHGTPPPPREPATAMTLTALRRDLRLAIISSFMANFGAYLGHDFEIEVSLDCKPMKGDWNGAGAHTNFSTRDMRDPKLGWDSILAMVEGLKKNHDAHIAVYGVGLEQRLTGLHA